MKMNMRLLSLFIVAIAFATVNCSEFGGLQFILVCSDYCKERPYAFNNNCWIGCIEQFERVFWENPFNSSLKALLEKERNALTPRGLWEASLDKQCKYLCSDVARCESRFHGDVKKCVDECMAVQLPNPKEKEKGFSKSLRSFLDSMSTCINPRFMY